ncbi:DUF308 domain-containing protein [Vagococcus carniphilus]|uniref:DUF308 domain-containing protein n=1 Tax=Vagococcus carniphilus TaxID=218144 RepID=UPI00288E6665|nr:DUF308 domain-containing protein [Vagococcus carniphilus]MDT2847781.1 DUF308 domain-containing protein [Vagococcus carniphilus]
MPEKVKSVVYFLDNHEWINTIMGALMLVTGIGLFVNYSASINQLMIIIGLFSILKGFLNFNNFFIVDSRLRHYKHKNIFITGAILNIIIGVILILNIYTSSLFLITLTSIWMVMDSIPYMFYVVTRRLGTQYKHNPFFLTYGLIILCAILNFATYYTHIWGPAITLGMFLIIATVNIFLFLKEH